MTVIGWFRELIREVVGGTLWFVAAGITFYALAWGFALAGINAWPVYVIVIVLSLWIPSQIFTDPYHRFMRIIRDEIDRAERRKA